MKEDKDVDTVRYKNTIDSHDNSLTNNNNTSEEKNMKIKAREENKNIIDKLYDCGDELSIEDANLQLNNDFLNDINPQKEKIESESKLNINFNYENKNKGAQGEIVSNNINYERSAYILVYIQKNRNNKFVSENNLDIIPNYLKKRFENEKEDEKKAANKKKEI